MLKYEHLWNPQKCGFYREKKAKKQDGYTPNELWFFRTDIYISCHESSASSSPFLIFFFSFFPSSYDCLKRDSRHLVKSMVNVDKRKFNIVEIKDGRYREFTFFDRFCTWHPSQTTIFDTIFLQFSNLYAGLN